MKIIDIVSSVDALNLLKNVKLPVKSSYWISRIADKALQEATLFHEKRNELIKKLGEKKDPAVDMYTVKPEHDEEFKTTIKELSEIEVPFDFTPININDLGDVEIEPRLLLPWLFTDKVEVPKTKKAK